MTDIAKRLGWDEPPNKKKKKPPSIAIPQGADFLSDPPDEFTVPKWNLRYRKLESNSSYISYICDNGQLVDQLFFLRNKRRESYNAVKALLNGTAHRHYFDDQRYGVASQEVEVSKRSDQYHKQSNGWSLCKLKETIGIDPTQYTGD